VGFLMGLLVLLLIFYIRKGNYHKDCQPTAVMVEFEKYTGPPFISSNSKIVPITPIQRKQDCFCHGCKRTQIPLRLGWGTTIQKCQVMTVGEGESNRYIVINPGSRTFESNNPGALFVVLSRAKTEEMQKNLTLHGTPQF
jgi:hypothetical protein